MKAGALGSPDWTDWLLLLLCASILASSFAAIAIALAECSPLQIAAARCCVATLALYCWSALHKEAQAPWGGRAVIGIGIVGFAIPFSLLSWAEQSLAPGHTAMLFCSGPVFALLLAYLWQRDELSSSKLLWGMALSTGGITLLSLDSASKGGAPAFLPALCVLGCALCYALAGFWTRRTQAPADRIARQSLAVASISLLGACAFEPLPSKWPDGDALWALLYLGLAPTAICSLIRYRQTQALGYTFVSHTGYLVPTLGAAIGVFFFSEDLSLQKVAGLMMALLGLSWSRRAMQTKA